MLKSSVMNSSSSPSTWSCCSGALCLMGFPCTSHSQSSSPPCLPHQSVSALQDISCYRISESPHACMSSCSALQSSSNCAVCMVVVSYCMYMHIYHRSLQSCMGRLYVDIAFQMLYMCLISTLSIVV